MVLAQLVASTQVFKLSITLHQNMLTMQSFSTSAGLKALKKYTTWKVLKMIIQQTCFKFHQQCCIEKKMYTCIGPI